MPALNDIWREAVREFQTTIGRRRSQILPPPPAPRVRVHAPVVEEEIDGVIVIGHVKRRPQTAETDVSEAACNAPYMVGGEAGVVEEEGSDYRRLWGLPLCESRDTSSASVRAPIAAATACGGAEPWVAEASAAAKVDGHTHDAGVGAASVGTVAGRPADNSSIPTSPSGVSAVMAAASALDASRVSSDTELQCGAAPPLATAVADSAHGVGDATSAGAALASESSDAGESDSATDDDDVASDGTTDGAARDGGHAAAHGHHDGRSGYKDDSGLVVEWRHGLLSTTLLLLGRLLLLVTSSSLTALQHGFVGFWQAHRPGLVYRHVLADPLSRQCIGQCLLLDVVLFRGALLFYERALPALCAALLGVSLSGDWRYDAAVLCAWTVPAYVICEVVSTSWHYRMHQRMAQRDMEALATPTILAEARHGAAGARHGAAGARHGATGRAPAVPSSESGARTSSPSSSASSGVFEMIYTRLVYVAFLVQLRFLVSVPIVGAPATLVLSALLHAYDSFELCWGCEGVGVSQRFRLIESHWLFFLGYGGVLATLSVMLSFWDLFAVRAVLYPLYIANASHARFAQLKCRPLPAFQASFGLINSVLQLAELRMRRRQR